jgi:hypothetical protein
MKEVICLSFLANSLVHYHTESVIHNKQPVCCFCVFLEINIVIQLSKILLNL